MCPETMSSGKPASKNEERGITISLLVPSILLAKPQSLEYNIEDIRARLLYQWEMRECCVLCIHGEHRIHSIPNCHHIPCSTRGSNTFNYCYSTMPVSPALPSLWQRELPGCAPTSCVKTMTEECSSNREDCIECRGGRGMNAPLLGSSRVGNVQGHSNEPEQI